MKRSNTRNLRELLRFRQRLDSLFGDIPGVSGSMIGVREKAGVHIDELTYTVVVSEKKPLHALPKEEVLPARVKLDGRWIYTDVMSDSRLQYQSGVFPESLGTRSEPSKKGTVSCFGVATHGTYLVTCAHCVGGKDNDPHTPDVIALWSDAASRYLPVGKSIYAVKGTGTGVKPDFGFSDAAIFSFDHAELVERARASAVLEVSTGSKPYERVSGRSAAGLRLGRIIAVDAYFAGTYADLMIRADAPGTFAGDSGMLWFDAHGKAVGIHAIGRKVPPGVGSDLSLCMSARRLMTALGVTLRAG